MSTDEEIQRNVMDELLWTPALKTANVKASVINGMVTLSGIVDSYLQKKEAEKATKRVAGVKVVIENILVDIPHAERKTDVQIAEAVQTILQWNSLMPYMHLTVTVENGWVTMEGEVEWEFQRNYAHNSIQNISGIIGLTDNVKVIPKLSADKIRDKIMSAYQRSASINASSIHIETEGAKVILSGHVNSWHEKAEAEDAAWAAPGVKWVENQIEVQEEIDTP